jgi:hypothetical protein
LRQTFTNEEEKEEGGICLKNGVILNCVKKFRRKIIKRVLRRAMHEWEGSITINTVFFYR